MHLTQAKPIVFRLKTKLPDEDDVNAAVVKSDATTSEARTIPVPSSETLPH
jgi:hypothetical protein